MNKDPMLNQAIPNGQLDPLLESLFFLCKHFDRANSRDALIAGLPLVENCLTPSLFVRAAKRAQLSANIVKRDLSDISALLMPAVLLLNNNQACVVTSIDHTTKSCKVVFPETGMGTETLTIHDLSQRCTGYVIFVKSAHRFDKRADEHKFEKPPSWFWGTIWRYRKNYLQVMIASLLINIFVLVSSIFVMNVYDRVIPNNATTTLWVLAVGVIIVYVFDFILRSIRSYLIDVSGKKSDILLASMIFGQSMGLHLEHRPESAGSFAATLQGFESIREFFTAASVSTLLDLPFVFLFLGIIYYIGGPIVLVPLISFPVVIIVAVLLEIPMRRAVKTSYLGFSQKNALMIEMLSNLETIKTLRAEGQMQKRWEDAISSVANASLISRTLSALVSNFTNYALQMTTVFTIVVGVYLIVSGHLTMGGLIACNILAGRTLAPLAQIANLITRLQQSRLGLSGLNQIMTLPTEHDTNRTFIHRPNLHGNIALHDVNFSYPSQEIKALENISLSIRAGEHIGVLGRIGSGKTTLSKLIAGLYQIQSGNLLLDETDIRQIDPAEVRRNIGFVGQDNTLFYGTIRENIVMSAPWVDDEQLLRVSDIAGVTRFVNQMPKGFDTQVGERGERLSGGQRQAVAIARALVADPPILLLDEPTSAMDAASEQQVLTALRDYIENKTLLLVTHKVSLLNLVSRLIIVDSGHIVADGPKQSVLEQLQQDKIRGVA